MQFPLHLLKTSEKSQVLVEVKSGDTYNGKLDQIDKFMNARLSDVIHTAHDGSVFHSIKEIFIKGSTIKYFRIQDQAIEKANEEAEIYNQMKEDHRREMDEKRRRGQGPGKRGGSRGRGDRGDRGGSRGRGFSRGK